MKKSIIITALLICSFFYTQSQERALNDLINKNIFTMPTNGIRDTRVILKKEKNRFNPINILSGSLLYFYQNIVSEQLSTSCSFEISCSEYTKQSIEQLGWFKGVFLGLNQYTNCVPRNHEHHAECAVNQDMKIINHIGNE